MTRTAATAGYSSKTVTVKKVKAKHFANQAGLDRLQELLVKATSNPNAGQNYANTIKRAFRSLEQCKHPILTQKDALQLKYIGPAMARRICPKSTGVEVASSSSSKPTNRNGTAGKKTSATGLGTENCSNDDNNLLATSAAAQDRFRNPNRPLSGPPRVCPRPAIPKDSSSAPKLNTGPTTAKEAAYASAKAEAENLVLPPRGPWKVILLVDTREHKSKQVVSSCKQTGIPCEERQLAIGDMAWIARCVDPIEREDAAGMSNSQPATKRDSDKNKFRTIEILVGTIVERKEVSDLASSLFGTRYAEQRLRLSQCGLPQVLFLVEGNLASVDNCPAETLQMAMMETRINLGFQIVQTRHLTDTVSVLKTLHSRIVQRTFPDVFGKQSRDGFGALPTFGGANRRRGGRGNRRASSLLELVFDTPPVPPFGGDRFITYPELKAKVEVDRERGTRSVRAITLAMLKQVPTLSQKKCTAIAHRYPTLNRLLEALAYPNQHETNNQQGLTGGRKNQQQHPKKIVQVIETDGGRRTIGPVSASEVYAACCTLEDGSTVACHKLPPRPPLPPKAAIAASIASTSAGNEENRKPLPTAAVAARREQVPPKRARKEHALATATNTAASSNALLRFLNHSSKHSFPEDEPARAFSTRKRPAPLAASAGKGSADSQRPFCSGIDSPFRNRQPQQSQETVDLLTPESSPQRKPKPKSFARGIGRMDLSDCSDASHNDRDAGRKNTGISPNVYTNTSAVANTTHRSSTARDASNADRTLPLSANLTDSSPRTNASLTNDGARPNTANAAKRVRAGSDGDEILLLSSDEDESLLPTPIATGDSRPSRDTNTDATDSSKPAVARRNSSIQETPKTSGTGSRTAGARLSLESSLADESFLYSSPDENLYSPPSSRGARMPSERESQSRTDNSDRDSGLGIVCLLDESDDDNESEGVGEGVAGLAPEKPSATDTTNAALLGLADRRNFVTTKRGGALPSTQESAYSAGGSTATSVEDNEFGTSLRERLGTIRGLDLREVIELDSDSE